MAIQAKEMIELLQQHHPHIGETEAIIILNRAKDDFCEKTEMFKTIQTSTTTVAGQLLYDVGLASDANVYKILNVWIGDSGSEIKAPRLQGVLNIKDSV
jgi:hypothetical protein